MRILRSLPDKEAEAEIEIDREKRQNTERRRPKACNKEPTTRARRLQPTGARFEEEMVWAAVSSASDMVAGGGGNRQKSFKRTISEGVEVLPVPLNVNLRSQEDVFERNVFAHATLGQRLCFSRFRGELNFFKRVGT